VNQGLFAAIAGPGSSVSNLFLEDVEIHAYSHAGALAGYTQNVLIENCGMTGSVSVVGFCAGGLVGEAGSSTPFWGCFSLGSVDGAVYVGGLVGYFFDGQIRDSFSRADAEATGSDCGGLIGHGNDNAIYDSYAAGRVTAPVGGGGLMGTGEHAPIVTGCYYDEDVSGQADNGYGEPRSTSQMKNQSTFSGWDFDTVWAMDSGRNDGYPYLQWAEDLFEEAGGSGGGCNAGAMNSLPLLLLLPLGLLLRKSR
jgi:Synergist-CTERM protein sorting domain-containing protein